MDAPCTCGHSRDKHIGSNWSEALQRVRHPCGLCDCGQYEPDPSFMEVAPGLSLRVHHVYGCYYPGGPRL